MRGRNRRGPNPLTRSFESNGPDVKVRGTAQHVAEKYTQLARDAHVSGDPVMAESYLQHAEHYYRLIAAAHQAQLAVQNGTAEDRDDEDDDFDTASDRFTFRAVQQTAQPGQNPSYSGERGQGDAGEGGEGDEPGHERQSNEPRQSQDRNPGRGDRPQFNDRNGGRNRDRNQDRGFRPGGDRNQDRNQERGGFNPQRPRRPQPDLEGAEQPVLPAFLTAPVRAVPIEVPETAAVPAPVVDETTGEARAAFRARPRRRRRVVGEGDEGGPAFETETPGSDQD